MPSTKTVIEARGLTKVYRMGEVDVHALRGVDIDLFEGEFTCLLGPSGSGKSTLLNILGGLDVPTAGQVKYLDWELTDASGSELTRYRRENVGFVFQFYNLIPSLTARENVELVTEIAKDPMDAAEALDLVGLGERLDHFPAQLSGGEQQRVAIARAVAKRPAVLMCDEPTGALDYKTGILVLEVIDRVNKELGTTTAVITHNVSIAAMTDRIITLADGRVGSTRVNAQKIEAKDLPLVISAIDKKLFRDLGRLLGQVITIALVVAGGIAGYVTMQGTYVSLEHSRAAYYERYRFADVFAHAKRVPDAIAARIEAVDGVASVYTRIVESVMVPVATLPEPASGTIVSVPEHTRPPMNDVFLREGRMLEPGRTDEVLLLESFATANGLKPGDRVPVVINGTLRNLNVAGIAMSPEFVFPMPVGGISSDPKRFAVLWMNHAAVAAAFETNGAFNDVLLRLQPHASTASVVNEVDRILGPYGSFGAVTRLKQPSNNVLEGELGQLRTFATVIPFIFLAVAAFLLNVVLSRLVNLQREQIAALKAVGYPDFAIGLHYVKLVSVIVLIGAIIGIAVGAYFGRGMTALYTQYFRFPYLVYRLDAKVVVIGVGVSLVSAVVGALASARGVARLPPAEAMLPPAPPSFKPTLLERTGFHKLLSPAARMILRELERKPLRLALSSVGIAMAVAILVVGRFQMDAMDHLMRVQFHEAWAEDVAVSFLAPLDERAVRDIEHLPGVLHAEGSRVVPARFRSGPRFRDSIIIGYEDGGVLRRPLDMAGREAPLPPDGMVVSRKLAELLGVSAGETMTVELREGKRETKQLLVVRTIDDMFGLFAYMRLSALQRCLGEEPSVSQVVMKIDPERLPDIQSRLKETPIVQSVLRKQTIIDQFREQSAQWMATMTVIMTLFASVIAVGVVYNNARVALSMRARDLGSLRVLGFTRAEVSVILLGELAVQLFLAIPIGLVIGNWMAHGIMETVDPEQYRMPVVISLRTYAFATVVALASGVASALLVRRKLDSLDLIAVLKSHN